MDRRRSVFFQRRNMFRRAVALIRGESVPRHDLSYSTISRSLVTFATMLAAPIEMLLGISLMIGTCRIATPGIVTASFNKYIGCIAICL